MLSDRIFDHQNTPAGGTARNPAASPHAVFVDRPVGLDLIHRPAVNLWVWRRRPAPALAAYLAACCRRGRIALDRQVCARDGAAVIAAALRELGLPLGPALDAWADDLAHLVALFAGAIRQTTLRLRLETVAEDRERLFHFDSVALRLLCTYVGPATQWLSENNLNRSELRLRGRSVAAANRAMVRDPSRICRLRSGWVAVLKGEGYPGNAGGGLVHRPGPAIGVTRLRLRLDAPRPSSDGVHPGG